MLVDEIYTEALALASEHRVTDIRVGLGYTAAALDDGRCGLAFTLHETEYDSCTVIAEAGALAGRKAADLISWIQSSDETACAIGLATVNALIGFPAGAMESDILDILPVQSGDAVGMIGYFGPLVDSLQKRARRLHIFEREAIPDLGVLPESAIADLLPQCQVAILSATALLNRTMDGLLDKCKAAREVAILGPSTPFLPGVFRGRGVTMLSGVHAIDAPGVLRVVSEAGGARNFGRFVRKLTCRL